MVKKEKTETNLVQELEGLRPHDHLCIIYESNAEWEAAIIPFIRIGLERKEKCIYVADTHTADELRNHLGKAGVAAASFEASGQLTILRESDVYTQEDSFDPDRIINLLIAETEKAVSQGYPALRVTGEMTFVLKGVTGSERLLEYETKLNRDLFPKYPCLAICQYDRWKFAPEIIKGVVMTHPKLIHGNRISPNFYYIPTEDFLNHKHAEMEVQHWLNNIAHEGKRKEELEESEFRYRRLFEAAKEGILILNAESGIIEDINPYLLDLVGYSKQEILGKRLWELGFFKDRFRSQDSFRELQEKGYIHYDGLPLETKDGRKVDVEFVGNSYLVNSERVIQCNIRDITERRKAERELKLRAELLDNTVDAIFLHTLEGKFTYVNAQAYRSLGYSKDELLKLDLNIITAPRVNAEAQWKQLLEEGQAIFESAQLRKDGSVMAVEVHARVIEVENNKLILSVIHNITEHKKAEAERQELERKAQTSSRLASVGEMASGIAHEINNPLTSVVGFSELLMEKDLPKDIRDDIKIIHDGSKRVADIVKRLLSFARQQKPVQSLTGINEIIESTLTLRKYALETSNIEVITHFAPELPWTVADAGQLQQVFMNIIVNTETEMRKAHGRGRLTIRTERAGDRILISFRDDGPGITKNNMDKIFDPFFTTKEVGEGTGLGLSLSHGIISEHRGNLYARSRPGKGATFYVELPIIDEAKQLGLNEPDEDSEAGVVSSARILVVDDEPSILAFLSEVLGHEGYEVETAGSGKEALALLEKRRYSLILCDIKLPGLSGIEIYGKMGEIASSLQKRVIFITGDVIGSNTMEFFKKSKAPHVAKPIDIFKLKKEVNRVITGGATFP